MQVFEQKFNRKEYLLFLRKFRGSMISKGKSSLSYKFFDKIRLHFKKIVKKNKKKNLNPDLLFKYAIFNLIPIIGTANVRRGRRIETIPILLKLRKRIVLINKWLISNQKNKSNVRGIKINDICRLIAYSLKDKGNAYDQKLDNLKKAYSARHILLKMGGRRLNKRAFRKLQNKVLKELKLKHDVISKEKKETLMESFSTLFNLIIFLKYKRKYRRIRVMSKYFRASLLQAWSDELSLEARWLIIWNWINYFANVYKRKKFKINTKKLESLKSKYDWVCQDIRTKI